MFGSTLSYEENTTKGVIQGVSNGPLIDISGPSDRRRGLDTVIGMNWSEFMNEFGDPPDLSVTTIEDLESILFWLKSTEANQVFSSRKNQIKPLSYRKDSDYHEPPPFVILALYDDTQLRIGKRNNWLKLQSKSLFRQKRYAALVYDKGGLGDPFNQLAIKGAKDFARRTGINVLLVEGRLSNATKGGHSEGTVETVENIFETLVVEGAEVVVAVGSSQLKPILAGSKEVKGPNGTFFIIDEELKDRRENLFSVRFLEGQAAYFAGIASVLASKAITATNETGDRNECKIGFIAGVPNDPIYRFGGGFVKGVQSVDNKCEIFVGAIGDWGNTVGGEKLAHRFINEHNVKVIFAAAGKAGSGVYQAIEDSNWIGEKSIVHWS